MARPVPTIDTAASHTGAWNASRKNGGAMPKLTTVATSSGKAGRRRIASRLPPTSPTAWAVTITDHAIAPP
jgi:hypothetical protein